MDSTAGQDAGAWHGAGFIYVLTNPSFPAFVKIGYADDVKERVKDLNRSSGLPFGFRVYCTYEVEDRLADKDVHAIIDRLAPGLRSVEEIDGRRRVREFYRMSPEDAWGILDGIAGVNGTRERLVLVAEGTSQPTSQQPSAPQPSPAPAPSSKASQEPRPVSAPTQPVQAPEPEPAPVLQPEADSRDDAGASPRIAALYLEFKDRVLALGGVEEDASQPPCVSFRKEDGQEFASAVLLKTRLKVIVRGAVPEDADAPEDGRAGSEDSMLRIASATDLDRAMPLVERAFHAVGPDVAPEKSAQELAEAMRRRAEVAKAGLASFLARHGSALRGRAVMAVRAGADWPDVAKVLAEQFEELGLKSLLAVEPGMDGTGKIFRIARDVNGDGRINLLDLEFNRLREGVSLGSPDVCRFRDVADVVIAAPPPGTAGEFATWATGNGRRFLALGTGAGAREELSAVQLDGARIETDGTACWLTDTEGALERMNRLRRLSAPMAVARRRARAGKEAPRLQDAAGRLNEATVPRQPRKARKLSKAEPDSLKSEAVSCSTEDVPVPARPLNPEEVAGAGNPCDERREERKMGNSKLQIAKFNKNDEFYTRMEDIEQEIDAYYEWNNDVFKDKTVLLPCDDPDWSGFTEYFRKNFKKFGLKKLISTCYAGGLGGKTAMEIERTSPLFNPGCGPKGKLLVIERNEDGDAGEPKFQYLKGNGDFRSKEVRRLRNEADCIVTNPPFSLFREFVAWIQEGQKQFIIMGNKNAITYKEFFPLLKENKVWNGYTSLNGGRWMRMPKGIDVQSAAAKDDGHGGKILNVAGVCWFTNIDHWNRHRPMAFQSMADNLKDNAKLRKKLEGDYGVLEYPQYDNYCAIEVPFVDAIPSDYDGVMGVPVTYLDKHCPEQFEILGCTESEGKGFSNGLWNEGSGVAQPLVGGQRVYKRIFIRNRHPEPVQAPAMPEEVAGTTAEEEEDEGLRPGM